MSAYVTFPLLQKHINLLYQLPSIFLTLNQSNSLNAPQITPKYRIIQLPHDSESHNNHDQYQKNEQR